MNQLKENEMSTTIQQSPVVNYNPKPQKSNTGKQIGLYTGAVICATDLSRADIFHGVKHNIRYAVESYNKNKDALNKVFTKKEYVKDFIKTEKANYMAVTAMGVATVMAGALLAGSLVDKAVDSIKEHRAEKKAQKMAMEEE